MIAAAMSTLYSFTPVLVFTRLFRATVMGWLSLPEKATPNRKSFQICVVCQMIETTKIGAELGSRILVKIWKKLAPSTCAAFTSPCGMATRKASPCHSCQTGERSVDPS